MKVHLSIFLLLLSLTSASKAQNMLLKHLSEEKRFGDIYQLSLFSSSMSTGAQQRTHQLNAARASLLLGDYESSIFYLRKTGKDEGEPINPDTNLLLAYNYLLLGNKELWTKLAYADHDKQHKEKLHIIETIDGYEYSPHDTALEKLQQNTELPVDIRQDLMDLTHAPRKSPLAAGLLNLVLPGSGYAYLGMWQTAALSFTLTSICLLTAHEQFLNHKPSTGTAAALVGSVFYLGGAVGAAESASAWNQKQTVDIRQRLLDFALPQLTIEWNF
ncbi:MAG: hypothetical protein KA436_06510 [Oligoflexales bacterium]|nr:hypothetical protein [Oligoflexales bacterium]